MLATVALGYADGIPRSLSNTGAAAIHGTRAAMVGRVSMDLITLDVTDMEVNPGDEAELLGETITLGEVAASAGTNEYEILTRLRRMPRVYEGTTGKDS